MEWEKKVSNLREGDYFENRGLDKRRILKLIFRESYGGGRFLGLDSTDLA